MAKNNNNISSILWVELQSIIIVQNAFIFFLFIVQLGYLEMSANFTAFFRQLFAIAYFDYSLWSKYIILRHILNTFITCFMDISTIFFVRSVA